MQYQPRNLVTTKRTTFEVVGWTEQQGTIKEPCRDRSDAAYIAQKMREAGFKKHLIHINANSKEICTAWSWTDGADCLRDCAGTLSKAALGDLCNKHPRIAVESRAILYMDMKSMIKFASRRGNNPKAILQWGDKRIPREVLIAAAGAEPWYAIQCLGAELTKELLDEAAKEHKTMAEKVRQATAKALSRVQST
jgi:hypothetical protein